jgi:hypothetical protein
MQQEEHDGLVKFTAGKFQLARVLVVQAHVVVMFQFIPGVAQLDGRNVENVQAGTAVLQMGSQPVGKVTVYAGDL